MNFYRTLMMKYGKNITLEKNTERFGNLNIIPNFA